MPDSVDVYGPVPQNCFDGNRRFYYEPFEKLPALKAVLDTYTASVAAAEAVATNVANKNFSLLGTNAVTADPTFNAGGGFNLNTHGASTDSAILLPSLSTSQTNWSVSGLFRPDNSWQWGCRIKTASSLTNTTIWAGLKLTNTPTSVTDADEVFFKYINGTDTTWTCVSRIGAAYDLNHTTSGVTVAASTLYRLWITVDSSRIARLWINGQLAGTTAALTASAALIPYIGVLSSTDASAKTVVVRDCWFSVPCS